jgi:hypothetical protein
MEIGWIDFSFGRVYFGPMVLVHELPELKSKYKINVVWNLCEGFSSILDKEKEIFTEVVHTPITDLGIPENLEDFVFDAFSIKDKIVKDKSNVYVHCLAGCGRTGMGLMALAYLDGYAFQASKEIVKYYCGGPETEEQLNFLEKLFKSLYIMPEKTQFYTTDSEKTESGTVADPGNLCKWLQNIC